MVVSMTGFAAGRGEGAGASWAWDLRSVNGKGLDLRLRLPEGVEGLEQALRAYQTGKRKSDIMSAMTAELTRADIGALAAYYASQRAHPVVYVTLPRQ